MSVDAGTIMRQAGMTAQTWMANACSDIDDMFGDGYAERNPELVAGYMTAAGLDEIGMCLLNLSEAIGSPNLSEAIGECGVGIADAIGEAAEAPTDKLKAPTMHVT